MPPSPPDPAHPPAQNLPAADGRREPGAPTTYAIKVRHGADVRRLAATGGAGSFAALEARVGALYGRPPPAVLRYADDEGDLVTVASDADLTEAIRLSAEAGRRTVELTVRFADEVAPGDVVTDDLTADGHAATYYPFTSLDALGQSSGAAPAVDGDPVDGDIVSERAPEPAPKPEPESAPEPAPSAGHGWFLVSDSDFCGGDAQSVPCGSVDEAVALLPPRPDTSATAYQYWAPGGLFFTKPVGHGAEWVARPADGSHNLFVYAEDMGYEVDGKILVRLGGVDCCGGDDAIADGIRTAEEATARARSTTDTSAAFFWHRPTARFIRKPKGRGARWAPGDGILFLWADRRVNAVTPESEHAPEFSADEAVLAGLVTDMFRAIGDVVQSKVAAEAGGGRSDVWMAEHPGIVCDATGQTPLLGVRYHKIGADYDLCADAFAQLDPVNRGYFEAIPFPGARPVPVGRQSGRCGGRHRHRAWWQHKHPGWHGHGHPHPHPGWYGHPHKHPGWHGRGHPHPHPGWHGHPHPHPGWHGHPRPHPGWHGHPHPHPHPGWHRHFRRRAHHGPEHEPRCQAPEAPAPAAASPAANEEAEDATEPPVAVEPPCVFAAELELLADMGFGDAAMNIPLLAAHSGDVNAVVPLLLEIDAAAV